MSSTPEPDFSPSSASRRMSTHFDLIITADYPRRSAEFQLHDAAGVQIAYRKTAFNAISISRQQGLFDLRNHLRICVDEDRTHAAVAEIGVCIAQEVLGPDIFTALWASQSQRTLRIQLPGAGDSENLLAAALARVPWEMARPNTQTPTLGERNLVVRVVHDMAASASTPIELAADDALRVLFVFAEARGSRLLNACKERRQLLQLFEQEIYPRRRVVAHFLTHGVTRERLAAQIQENGGYHIVHWSGHGHMNLLELCQTGGARDHLTGQQLLELFTGAGGFLPRLFFLSACHSGDILPVRNWADFIAVAQGKELGTRDADTREVDTRDITLANQPGYTGTAHALLQGGVPSVVAMRYAVGDSYAREVAVAFYRALLAHTQPKPVATALALARKALLDEKQHLPAHFAACDHATPVLYGEAHPGLSVTPGRSPSLNPRNRRLHPINELTLKEHAHFVGRTWELAGLGAQFIGASTSEQVKPVAVIHGQGGMGKTALTAEALALWESRFEWVLLYQAKPNRLELEATLRDIHMKLMSRVKVYHDHVREYSADAIYREASADFTGSGRLTELTRNLLRALRDEAILLVLDNFETNLKPTAEPAAVAGQSVWACQDPAWDECLHLLASELVGSPSRVLITCRRPLAALAEMAAHVVLLGSLPGAEAALFIKEHPVLSGMVFGGDVAQQALALRLLNASRFHPLLMDRLAKLAASAALLPQLLAALDTLENTKDFAQLPALFASTTGDAKELAYLEDALTTSLDQLIRDCSPDARRLLWIIALANQPEALGLVKEVWGGESLEQTKLWAMKRDLERLHELAPEKQEFLSKLPQEIRGKIDALPPKKPAQPDMAPLLSRLVSVGLVTEQRDEPAYNNPELTCHELVRERICAWMAQHPQDRAELTENTIRLAYAERLEAVFKGLLHRDMSAALGAGSRALVYCVQAGAWDRLGGFASSLVTSTGDPRLLTELLPHLHTAAASAPEGRPRWSCLGYLADALGRAGRPDTSLLFYAQAATQARAVAEAAGVGSRQAWSDFAAISGNWANALGDVCDFGSARQRQLESADAAKKAGCPDMHIIASELEALRIDIMQGQVLTALPEVAARLAQVEAWWQRHLAGQPVPEAQDAEFLARVLIAALDIATEAHIAQEDWPAALHRIDRILEVKRALERPAKDIAGDRMNRANVLAWMQERLGEAKAEMEACLELFTHDPARRTVVLSSLAALFNKQDDIPQAIAQERRALALCEQLPDPAGRAISHGNLANYLERNGTSSALVESPRHQLAALLYRIVAELFGSLMTSLHKYAIDIRRAHATGTALAVPHVAELLSAPAFAPLKQWLAQRQVNLDELQTTVDYLLNQARQAAQENPPNDTPNPMT